MGNTIRHMFDGVRPFDWLMLVVELLVLLLIFYEVIINLIHRRKERKRRLALGLIVTSLAGFMEKGCKLQLDTPDPITTTWGSITPWIDSVKLWAKDTSAFLAQHSSRAATAFGLIGEIGVLTNPQPVYKEPGSSFPIEGPQRESYQRLVAQLTNLRSIIEKPEAYF